MSDKVIILRPELVARDAQPVTEEVAEQQRIIRDLSARYRELRRNRNVARS
jgi:hypothetical protein